MDSNTSHKYVSEVVWLPTYVAIIILVLGNVKSSGIATLTLLVALIGSRMILEFIYRIIFNEKRLLLKTGIMAFICQLLVWVTIIFWSKV